MKPDLNDLSNFAVWQQLVAAAETSHVDSAIKKILNELRARLAASGITWLESDPPRLKKFPAGCSCQKCGAPLHAIVVRYCADGSRDNQFAPVPLCVNLTTPNGEHLHRLCTKCNFEELTDVISSEDLALFSAKPENAVTIDVGEPVVSKPVRKRSKKKMVSLKQGSKTIARVAIR